MIKNDKDSSIIGKSNIVDKIELRGSTVMLREDGIMHFDIKEVDEFTVDDVNDVLNAVGQMGDGKSFPNLVTIDQYIEISKEAKILSASPEGNRYTIADAFILKSIPLKLFGNFYLKINKPVKPTRLFTEIEPAIKWLRTFLDREQ